ncbi:16S rRNA (guanine(527)-N(7))-methyltransferase RsmG [Aestuariibius sp. HNIBRBA575]|uniref:16S rRNA (guanine(527)-N(7))-methyltransferase RsmG n=1 Tax=Aestuariibius sp. HNIBRBA575 TaxID=3233343 RepID=UPI0034A49DA6
MNREVGLSVSRETIEKLELFQALLLKWTKKINLISPSTVEESWSRHIVDSAQIWQVAPKNAKKWLDLGSGGGLPGVVLHIISQELRPDLQVTLVESDQRKSAFLRTAKRELGNSASLEIISERIENIFDLKYDIVSARALADLPTLIGYAHRFLIEDGLAIFPKGRNADVELEQAKTKWRFQSTIIPSKTDPEAKILSLKGIRRA